MIEYEPDKFKGKKLAHQVAGVKHFLRRPRAANFDEMGLGKTKQTIDSAQVLYQSKLIRAAVVVCPAAVRSVWDDTDEESPGEIFRWSLESPQVIRFDARFSKCMTERSVSLRQAMVWIVTNYELLRQPAHLKNLLRLCAMLKPFMLVLDECSRIKSRRAVQTKAVNKLAAEAQRVALLDGTPYGNNLMDLWSPLSTMDPESVHNMSYWGFRNRYAIMGGWQSKQVVGYHKDEVDKLTKHLRHWVIRRTKDEELDLPPKLYTHVDVTLSDDTWALYTQMRDELVVWAENSTQPDSIASHGAIKVLRLAQLCCGYLGGILDDEGKLQEQPREIGREKLDAFLDWLSHSAADANRIIVWCRFRQELLRAASEVQANSARLRRWTAKIIGGQSARQREDELDLFQRTERCVLFGQPQAGGWGLNLQSANVVAYLSNDYNLVTRLQSEDRAHRQGQKAEVLYVDFLARSPKGFKTVDHAIMSAIQKKEDIAQWTYRHWAKVLKENEWVSGRSSKRSSRATSMSSPTKKR